MSTTPVGAGAAGRDGGDAVWIEVSDALVAGITHDLNGRVSALSGLLSVISPADPDPQLLALLQSEGERLDATVALLRLYPRGEGRGEEAIDPRELLPALLALHARRDDREGATAQLEIAPEAPPARAERTWLARALLVLFAHAGAQDAAGGAGFTVRAGGSGAEAVWSVATVAAPARAAGAAGYGNVAAPAGAAGAAVPAQAAAGAYVQTAAAFLERAGGTLRSGRDRWDAVLPAVIG